MDTLEGAETQATLGYVRLHSIRALVGALANHQIARRWALASGKAKPQHHSSPSWSHS